MASTQNLPRLIVRMPPEVKEFIASSACQNLRSQNNEVLAIICSHMLTQASAEVRKPA